MFKVFKGFIICLILFVSIIFTFDVDAANAYFVWEKTVIDVPVNAPLEGYKDDYVVKLYVNGVESNDFTVEYEVNTSTFSTVLTHIIGKYTVYYKVYSKNNYISSTQAIVFNVIDNIKPIIKLKSDVVNVDYGKVLADYDFYTASDNYSSKADLKVIIDDNNVLYNTLGSYNATIKCVDVFDNEEVKSFKVNVVDRVGPNIKILQALEFSYGTKINYKDYFSVTDNYNGDLSKNIKVIGIDLNKLGYQEVSVSCSDYSLNTTEITVTVLILDNIAPTINLINPETSLDITLYETFDEDFFNSYLFSYSDNYNENEELIMDIDIKELECRVADFKVYFSVIDSSGNETTEELLVKLRETVGPQIIVDDKIMIEIGEEVDFLTLATVLDEFDIEASSRLTVDTSNLDVNTKGKYQIVYTCFNTSGIYTDKVVDVIVGDEITVNESSVNLLPLLIVVPIVVITGIIVLVLIKKKKKTK